jgi:hypothetical protein
MGRLRYGCMALAVVALAACGAHAQHARQVGVVGEAQGTEPVRLAAPSNGALPATARCGRELWAIKVLTDPAAGQVQLAPRMATVQGLTALPAPPDSYTRRRTAAEKRTYAVRATVTGYKLETDSDIHLVLQQGGSTMIAEIPDPACMSNSRVRAQVAKARAAFLHLHPLAKQCFNCMHVTASLAGVGFFDRLHGQHGVAPDGIELHPVLVYNEP